MFFFLTGKSRFWKRFWQPFLDLINSKAGTHVYKLLNWSDRQKVAKTFFKNTKYYKNMKIYMRPWIPRYQSFLSKNVENQFWHMLGGPGLAADGWLTSAVFLFFAFGVYNIFIFCVWRLQYFYFLRLQYYYFLCLFCSIYIF